MVASTPSPFVVTSLMGIFAVLIGLALLGLPGLLLLLFGLRGKRIDQHPRCRGCGYDLSGHDGTPASCPECGRELANVKRAIRIGNRRRRPIMATLGALMVTVSLCSVGTITWARSNQIKLIEHYPVWLLQMELRSDDFPTSELALLELQRRQLAGELSRRDVVSTVDRLLPLHASPSEPWTDEYSAFVEQAWRNGDISDERMTAYVRAAIDQALWIESRPHIRTGGALPIRMHIDNKRLSQEFDRIALNTPGMDAFVLRHRIGEVRNGDRIIRDLSGATSSGPVSAGYTASTTSVPIKLEPGEHSLQVTAKLELYIAPGDDMYKQPEYSGDEVEMWEVTVDLPVRVLGEDDHFIELIPDDDPERAAQLRDAVVIDLVNIQVQVRPDYSATYESGRGFVDIHKPIANVAFTVYGRLDGQETKLGTLARLAGENGGSGWLAERVADVYPDASAIDIILRPDRAVAEQTLDMNRIWGGELVFENIPLRPTEDVQREDSSE